MAADCSDTLDPPPPTVKPRFSWPMRIFLSLFLFHMVFRSLTVMFPWKDWCDELEMDRHPRPRFATPAERAKMRPSDEKPYPLLEDFRESFEGVWVYQRPWPGPKTRPHLQSADDWGKFALCWLTSRLDFVENVLGINHEWPMFQPSTSKGCTLARARLYYADGSTYTVRLTADPRDLTNYSHWFQEKILDYELHVRKGEGRVNDCTGYCNLLAHWHPHNEEGSPLVKISLFGVRYEYPTPDDDPLEHWRQQTGPPDDQIRPVFFEYDVAKRKGEAVKEPESKTP